MKRLLTVLLALGVSLTQNAGFVYAEETEENVEEITEETEIVEQDATTQSGDIETPETSDNYVTVKFDVNEHGRFFWNDQELVHEITVEKGQKLNEYPDPYSITDGLVFAGWSKTKDGGVDLIKYDVADYAPTKNEYYYAVWTEGYSITLDANGGYFFNDHNRTDVIVSVIKDEPARENPEPMTDAEGMGFKGWSFTKGGNVDLTSQELAEYVFDSDKTLYAVWSEAYKVTLNCKDGHFDWSEDESVKVIDVPKGNILNENPWAVPNAKGMIFLGWSNEEDGEVAIDKYELWEHKPEGDETLYAVYAEGYNFTFDANGGYYPWGDETNTIATGTALKGERIDGIPEPETKEEGKVFAGWSTDKNGGVEYDRNYIHDYIPDSDLYLYAVYAEGYRVTLDCNGGHFDWDENVTSKVVEVPEGANLKDNPWAVSNESGKIFVGWSHEKTGEAEISKHDLYDYVPKGNETLYAIYDEGYNITFDANGGYYPWGDQTDTMASGTAKKGDTIDGIPEPDTREEGKVFAGWSTDKNGGVEFDKRQIHEYIPESDMYLYAVYVEGYRVVLDPNGGRFDWDDEGNEPIRKIGVVKGEKVDENPWCISKEAGKAFAGWSRSKTGKVEIDKHELWEFVPEKNETLYAIYADGYKVTLDCNGGHLDYNEEESIKVIDVVQGSNIKENPWAVSNEEGKIFIGWSHEIDGEVEISKYDLWEYVPKGNETLYAIYDEGYNITFDANGGYYSWGNEDEAIATGTAIKGERMDGVPEPLTHEEGKVFAGWSRNKDGNVEISKNEMYDYIPDSDLYLYAIYAEGYKVILDCNGGHFDWNEEETSKLVNVLKGDAMMDDPWPVSFEEGKVFVGWSHSKTGEVEISKNDLWGYKPQQDETLYAIYTDGYIVTLDANGGYFDFDERTETYVVTVAQGKQVNDNPLWPTTEEEGKVFAGWSHSKTGDVEIDKRELSGYVPKGDETLYAIFKEGFTIWFDGNGGYFGQPGVIYGFTPVVKGDRIIARPIPETDVEGLVFAGWSYTADGDVEIGIDDIPTIIPDKEERFYAVWKEGYTITFDANGGHFWEGENHKTETITIVEGERVDTNYRPEAAEGLAFAGWSHEPDGEVEITWDALPDYVPQKSETLYAIYKEGYQITLHGNGGYFWDREQKDITVYAVKGDKIGLFENPFTDEEGKVHAGWSHTSNGDVEIDRFDLENYVPKGNEELFAVWKDGYTITLNANGGFIRAYGLMDEFAIGVVQGQEFKDDVRAEWPNNDKILLGWSTEPGGDPFVSADELVHYVFDGSMTIYAVWGEAETVSVSFDVNGKGKFYEDDQETVHVITVKKGKSLHAIPDPYSTTPGKVFEGWSKTPNGGVDLVKYDVFDYAPEEDEYYYAVWSDGYSIKLNANGGSYFGDPNRTWVIVSVLKGKPAMENPEPSLPNSDRIFAGWSKTPDGDIDYFSTELARFVPEEDMELFAVYRDGYRLFAEADGGYFFKPGITEFENFISKGDTLMIAYPTTDEEGKAFAGWTFEEGGKTVILGLDEIPDYKPQSSLNLKAVWGEGYTIVLDANGGYFPWDDEPETITEKVLKGRSVQDNPEPYLRDSDLIFAGWSRTKDGDIDITSDEFVDYIPEKDETFYAVYKKEIRYTLDCNGGYFGTEQNFKILTSTGPEGSTMEMLLPVSHPNQSLKHIGWSFKKDGNVNIPKDKLSSYKLTEDITLYAVFLDESFRFDDVKDPNKSFYGAVYWAYENGITTGTSKEPPLFSPFNTCTRAQFVTFLWRQMGQPEPTLKESPFKDVQNKDLSYYKAVLWAVENEITTGTSPTTFDPGKKVTRAQAVTFLWRANNKPTPKTTVNPFKDVKAGLSYSDAVLWAFENNITTGTSATTFNPGGDCTRAATVTFLYRTYAEQ